MLDELAAMKAASWGQFQILGENHVDAGFASVEAFVTAMMISRKQHLRAFSRFVAANRAMRKAIIAKDWAGFAVRYNGRNYAKHHYDTRIGAAYERLSKPAGSGR